MPKEKRYCYPSSLYRFVKVITAEEAAGLNIGYARQIAEDDEPDFKVGEWLFRDISGAPLNLSAEYVKTCLVEVELEVPDPSANYSI
jgi:hypothetical protein